MGQLGHQTIVLGHIWNKNFPQNRYGEKTLLETRKKNSVEYIQLVQRVEALQYLIIFRGISGQAFRATVDDYVRDFESLYLWELFSDSSKFTVID